MALPRGTTGSLDPTFAVISVISIATPSPNMRSGGERGGRKRPLFRTKNTPESECHYFGEPHPPNAVFYRIHIEEITGRRATADPVESAVGLSRAERPAREK